MNITYRGASILAAVAFAAFAVYGFGLVSFAQTAAVACNPVSPTVLVGQAQTFTAIGGNGVYAWSGQNLNVTNPLGTQFTVSYPVAGTYMVSVTSGGQVANCVLTVVAPSIPTPPVTPGLPDTGGGFGQD